MFFTLINPHFGFHQDKSSTSQLNYSHVGMRHINYSPEFKSSKISYYKNGQIALLGFNNWNHYVNTALLKRYNLHSLLWIYLLKDKLKSHGNKNTIVFYKLQFYVSLNGQKLLTSMNFFMNMQQHSTNENFKIHT